MPSTRKAERRRAGSLYDPEFEHRIGLYRRYKRLLVARNLNYRATKEDFETVCRGKLSEPESVRFFWQTTDQDWQGNPGFAMLGFETRAASVTAQNELQNLGFHGRQVRIERASTKAHRPASSRAQLAASTTAAALNTAAPAAPLAATTTTATTAETSAVATTAVTAASTTVADGLAEQGPKWTDETEDEPNAEPVTDDLGYDSNGDPAMLD